MSAAELSAPSATRTVRAPPPRFLLSELRLIFSRKRNIAGLVVLAAVPIFIAIAVKSTASQPGGDAPDFFRSITENGLFVSLSALTIELGLFLPLALAAISRDAVAGEANLGTLRYLLNVPVSRLRLLGVKYLAIVICAFLATFLVTIVGMAIGLALFGGGDLTTLSGTQISFANGLARVVLASAYVSCALASLG